jgi:hypothetical protein
MIKVEGHNELRRDDFSKAIINIDNDGYKMARMRKKKALKQQEEMESLRNDIDDLKSMMQTLILKLDK